MYKQNVRTDERFNKNWINWIDKKKNNRKLNYLSIANVYQYSVKISIYDFALQLRKETSLLSAPLEIFFSFDGFWEH